MIEFFLDLRSFLDLLFTIITEKLLGSLTSVKRLGFDLSPFEITYPTGSIFSQLVNIYINVNQPQWWNLLTIMLENSPNLQVLTIANLCSHDGVVGEKWNEPKHVPECMLSHLETFVWERYDWGRKEMASYILRNARHLKKATFSTVTIESEEVSKLEERRKMLKELEIVVRGSNSCHLLFEFDSTPLVDSVDSPFWSLLVFESQRRDVSFHDWPLRAESFPSLFIALMILSWFLCDTEETWKERLS